MTSTIIDHHRRRANQRAVHEPDEAYIDGELHCVAKHKDASRLVSIFYVNTMPVQPFLGDTVSSPSTHDDHWTVTTDVDHWTQRSLGPLVRDRHWITISENKSSNEIRGFKGILNKLL